MKSITTDVQARLVAKVIAGRAFTIKTPPAEILFAALHEWLTVGLLGGVVVGPPRLGKTHGIRWVLKKLPVIFGQPVPWVEVPVRDELLISAGGFFQHILNLMGDFNHPRSTVSDRRDRLTDRLITLAQKSPVRTVIVWLDEAQQLSEQHYKWLLNISNELDPLGLRIFCLLSGQMDILRKKEEFSEMIEMHQIVGRFMVGELAYDGIRNAADLQKCLAEMDIASPRGVGITFPQCFVPIGFSNGLRLAESASHFWTSFDGLWRKVRPDPTVISMQYLCSAVALYLQALSLVDDQSIQHRHDLIERAVVRSGFEPAMKATAGGVNRKPRKLPRGH